MKIKKLVCALVAVLMILAVMPVASLAQTAAEARYEARQLAKLDTAWNSIEATIGVAMVSTSVPTGSTPILFSSRSSSSRASENCL